jgi:hypothetical protein
MPTIASSSVADSIVADSIITDANILEPNLAGPPASSIAATQAVDSAIIRDCCNLGYATACPLLPASRDWDAVRFTVIRSAANQITLCYICELAHAPKAHGTLTYDLNAESWRDAASRNVAPANAPPANAAASASADPRVRRLAASFLHAYRVRQSLGQSLGKNLGQIAEQSADTIAEQSIQQSVEPSADQSIEQNNVPTSAPA